jgi:hypothetical protein
VMFAAHGKDFFTVQRLTAMIVCTATTNFPIVRESPRSQNNAFNQFNVRYNKLRSDVGFHPER